MKKALLPGLILMALGASAQNGVEPLELPEFYSQKISPDGRWLYSNTGMDEVVIYDLFNEQYNAFYETGLGNGNPFTNTGIGVGYTGSGVSEAAVIKGDKVIHPIVFKEYAYSTFNGVTLDGTRAVGIVLNPNSGGMDDDNRQMYLPFVVDMDEDGACSNFVFLPHPDKDYFGLVPQYCSATWISNDGKTILGQVVDFSGMFIQPILYRQDEAGEWSYSIPTESMLNPDHIEMPQYPGNFDLDAPNPIDFMSEEKREEYIEDYTFWETEGNFDEDLYPNPANYMTAEEINAYNKAVDEYKTALDEYNDVIIPAFYEARNEVIRTSVAFVQNGCRLNGEGTLAALTRRYAVDNDGNTIACYETYILDITDGSIKKIESENKFIVAMQVLNDGIILGCIPPTSGVTSSYVYVPGASDYVPVEEYIATINPGAAQWMQDNLVQNVSGVGNTMISGNGVASNDFSVFAAGVPAYMFPNSTNTYFTYVFEGLKSGVESVAVDNSAVKVMKNGCLAINGNVADLSVTDLSGRTVFAMSNASGNVNTNLNRGIYVVAYTDASGQRVCQKVRF